MFIDRSIDPTADQVRALRDAPDDQPITMVNLLKFRAQARYEDGEAAPRTGREAYARYKHAFTETVGAVSQAQVMFSGPVQQVFIGQAGTPEADWDEVLVVRYPSRKAFLKMVSDPDYQQITHLRSGALVEAVLQPTTVWKP